MNRKIDPKLEQRSKDFNNFCISLRPRSWDEAKDGLDTSALFKLEGEERTLAEDLMIEDLEPGCWRDPVLGLGRLKTLRAKDPLIHALSRAKSPVDRALIRYALWKITQDDGHLLEILHSLPELEKENKFDLITYSYIFWDKELPVGFPVQALKPVLESSDDIVRYNARRALAFFYQDQLVAQGVAQDKIDSTIDPIQQALKNLVKK